MSSSHNLYTTDDSDRDSFSDELTPSNGYFNREQRMGAGMSSQHIQPVLDPSVVDTKPEPKTLISPPHLRSTATGGKAGPSGSRSSLHSEFPRASISSPPARRALSPAPQVIDTSFVTSPSSPSRPLPLPPSVTYSPPPSSTSSPIEEVMYSEQSPLVNGPPPAYSPTPAPIAVAQPLVIEHRYSTFPQEERGFLPAREPQSMGGPVDELDERSNPPRQFRSSVRRAITAVRNSAGMIFLCLLLFTASFTTFRQFFLSRSNNPGNFPGTSPVDGSPVHDRPVDAEGPYCPAARLRDDEVVYEFATGEELSVVQTTHDSGGNTPVSTYGEIRLRTIPKNSKHGDKPYFTINAHVSDPELEVAKTWDQDSRSLKISMPRTAHLNGYGRHCISVEVTAYFPENSRFTKLAVEAVSLTITVMDDIKVYSDRAKFGTLSGDIYFPNVDDEYFYKVHQTIASRDPDSTIDASAEDIFAPFSARSILIETISGNIKGTYPLKDLLGISSQSGSVKVRVLPAPADESAPAPADLEIQTSSGSIQAFVPISNAAHSNYTPPPRNYITRVHSNSGSISGSYYLGSESTFKSNSGSIKIDTLPVLPGIDGSSIATKNSFETHTLSGSTAIDVQDPIFLSPLTTPPTPPTNPGSETDAGNGDPYRLIPIITNPSHPPNSHPLFTIDNLSLADNRKLHTLKSSHSTTSASINVHYPNAWEGIVHAKTVSGRVVLKGEGLRVLKSRKGPGFTEMEAQRGTLDKRQGATVEMNSLSGSVQFGVGEVV